jgi:hypothetical protein
VESGQCLRICAGCQGRPGRATRRSPTRSSLSTRLAARIPRPPPPRWARGRTDDGAFWDESASGSGLILRLTAAVTCPPAGAVRIVYRRRCGWRQSPGEEQNVETSGALFVTAHGIRPTRRAGSSMPHECHQARTGVGAGKESLHCSTRTHAIGNRSSPSSGVRRFPWQLTRLSLRLGSGSSANQALWVAAVVLTVEEVRWWTGDPQRSGT